MHNSDATTNSNIEPTNMRLRPYLSVSGPINSCPAASPIIPVVRLIEASAGVVWK